MLKPFLIRGASLLRSQDEQASRRASHSLANPDAIVEIGTERMSPD
jgi:hypothetical protein